MSRQLEMLWVQPESWIESDAWLFRKLLDGPPRSVLQFGSGKGNKKQHCERPAVHHPKLFLRLLPTGNGASRFAGSTQQ